MFLGVEWEPTLLGLAAIITSLSGIMTAIIGARRKSQEAKDKADEECRQRLRTTRQEAEDLANELHQMRMGLRRSYNPPDERPEELDTERWSHLE